MVMNVTVYHDAIKQLHDISFGLKDLASAMERTGQIKAAIELRDSAEAINKNTDIISSQVRKDLKEMIDTTNRNSATILEAVLVGERLRARRIMQVVKRSSGGEND
jgi:hypothetical protein